MCCYLLFFFFKQKTAYEMRISDWSSDVCSSDLPDFVPELDAPSVWPARLAARSTWLMKLLALGARVLRMRPGRTRKSLSPSLMAELPIGACGQQCRKLH